MSWSWVVDHRDQLVETTRLHVQLTAYAIAWGSFAAFVLGLLSYRFSRLYPAVLGASAIAYSIPSLAFIVFLVPYLGFANVVVVIPLATYTLVILVRNIVEGLRGTPEDVRSAATALGYGDVRRLFAVELPLALPAVIAGLRTATASTISLVSVGGIVGSGGLGQLFIEGAQLELPIEVVAGIVLTVLLALIADACIVAVDRVLTPWTRAGA